MGFGKMLLGGGLGFVLGGPIGALIGALVGAFSGNKDLLESNGGNTGGYTGSHNPKGAQSTSRVSVGDIRVSTLVLMACVMKADGRLLKSELQRVKDFLNANYSEGEARQALQFLKELLKKDIDPVAVSQQIGQYVDYSTRLEIVHMLLDLANADGDFDTREEAVIQQIAANMHLTQADYDSLAALYRKSQDANWAYTVLEISPDATDDEVKKAYRAMALKYHPDKVAGAGEEVVKNATEKFRAVNEAYEHIKAQRGFK